MSEHSSDTCLLMLAGDAPTGLALAALRALLPEKPYIIAADGGALHLAALGLTPQMLVGDNDSLDAATLALCHKAGVEFMPLQREKDFTDGEAALRTSLERGYTRLHIFGALGGNLDHQLGNLLLPLAFRGSWQEVIFYGADCRACYCLSSSIIKGSSGDTISLLPLSSAVTGLTLTGFRYPLTKAETYLGQSLCLRNQLAEPYARVELDEGVMLVIHYPQLL